MAIISAGLEVNVLNKVTLSFCCTPLTSDNKKNEIPFASYCFRHYFFLRKVLKVQEKARRLPLDLGLEFPFLLIPENLVVMFTLPEVLHLQGHFRIY